MGTALKLDLTFDQILSLVKQLPKQEKLKLSKELEKEVIEAKLSKLLKTLRTDEPSLETIDEEVETVRKQIYESQKH